MLQLQANHTDNSQSLARAIASQATSQTRLRKAPRRSM